MIKESNLTSYFSGALSDIDYPEIDADGLEGLTYDQLLVRIKLAFDEDIDSGLNLTDQQKEFEIPRLKEYYKEWVAHNLLGRKLAINHIAATLNTAYRTPIQRTKDLFENPKIG